MSVGGVRFFRNVSIRFRLLVLFTLPALAIVSTRTFELREEHQQRVVAANNQAVGFARRGIELQENLISEVRTLLQILSRVPDVLQGTPDTCRQLLAEAAQDKPWLKGLWVAEPDGHVVCSTIPGGVGLTF